MLIYSVVMVCTLCAAYFYLHHKRHRYVKIGKRKLYLDKCVYFILMILPSAFVMGFRYGISIDYQIYVRGFYDVLNGNISLAEIGFQLLEKMCAFISGGEPWSLFLVTSLVTVICFFVGFNNSKNFLLATVLFFGVGIYFDAFNGIRQYMVVAVFIMLYPLIRDGDWKKYIIVCLLCALIHTSALLLIPLYFLRKPKINKYWVLAISLIVLTFKDYLLIYMMQIMRLFPKYNEYLVRNTLFNQVSFSTSGLVFSIISVIPCIIVEKGMVKSDEGRFLFNLMHIGVIIAVCSSFLPFAERLLYYSRGYMTIAIPFALSLMHGKTRRFTEYGVALLTVAMTMIGILALNWYAVLPYQSIFGK